MNGCHVAAHVWATWHLTILRIQFHMSNTHWSTCLPSCQPRHLPLYLPRHQYGCAMCHPCSGDTCHSLIGPHIPTTSATCPHHCMVRFHVSPLEVATSDPPVLCHVNCTSVQPVQSTVAWNYTDCIAIIFLPV
jgi:hypothetical protein